MIKLQLPKVEHSLQKDISPFNYQIFINKFIAIKIEFAMMIVLFALLIAIQSKWVQNGQWHSSNQRNGSQLLALLATSHGSAQTISYLTEDKYQPSSLSISLKNEKQNNTLTMNILIRDNAFASSAIYHLTNASITFAFSKGQTSSAIYYFSNISFNLTLLHRQKIYLNSTDQNYVVELIDNQSLFPYFLFQLYIVFLISFFIAIPMCFFSCNNFQGYSSIFSQFTVEIIYIWVIRVLVEIVLFQQYLVSQSYLRYSIYGLAVVGIIIHIPLAIIFISKKFTFRMKSQRQKLRRFFKVIVEIAFVYRLAFGFYDHLTLLYFLGIAIAFQIEILVSSIPNLFAMQAEQQILHFVLYLFPIAIFPYYYQQLNYPKVEAELWWTYILFYFFEVTVFYLKSHGGAFLKLKYKVRTCRMSKSFYNALKETLCAICLKPIEIDVSIASGEIIKADNHRDESFILHPCNHYFHKACIGKIRSISVCFFDNQKWQKQSQMSKNSNNANKKSTK